MTAGSSVVKITAKTALKNKWLKSSISCIVFIMACFICYNLSGLIAFIGGQISGYVLSILLSVFLLLPLFMGVIRFFWRMILDADDNPILIFYYFSNIKLYKRSLHTIFELVLRLALIGIVLFIPAIIVDVFSEAKVYDLLNIPIPLWTSNLYYLSVFLKSAAGVVLFLVMSRYYLLPLLVIADEEIKVKDAVKTAVLISKKTILDYLTLIFSFIGWIIVSVLVFPLIFTLPYIITALLVHSRFAFAEHNQRIKIIKEGSSPSYSVNA